MRRSPFAIPVVAVGLGLTAVFATNSGGSRGLDQLANRGEPVAKISAAGTRILAHLGANDLRLLGQVGQRQFFRLIVRGNTCLAFGDVDAAGATPTDVYCPSGRFPSADLPVYDDPAVEIARDEPRAAQFLEIDGLAADGVKSVELVGSGGVIASAPVVGNTFALDVAGVDIAGTRLVARDDAGRSVFSRSYSAPPS
jgi:hypothetical protein